MREAKQKTKEEHGEQARRESNAERLTAAECDRRALAALNYAGYRGLSAADIGYLIRPD